MEVPDGLWGSMGIRGVPKASGAFQGNFKEYHRVPRDLRDVSRESKGASEVQIGLSGV